MTQASAIRLIVFDFDGTLCDSADIKTVAFRQLYLDERGEAFAEAVEQHHLENAGISRYDKIRHVEETMIGESPSEDRIEAVASRYSQLVEDAVVAAPLFAGVEGFLQRWSDVIPLTVASATPTEELRRIVARKGLSSYFASVDGSPESKAGIIDSCVARLSAPRDATVMIGDQPSDADAARAAGVRGAMITDPASWAEPFETYPDFEALAIALEAGIRSGIDAHRGDATRRS